MKNNKLVIRLLVFCISIVIFSFIYYRFCNHEKDFYYGVFPKPKNTVLNNHIDYLYFSIQVQSTLGFGDMAPKTNKARIEDPVAATRAATEEGIVAGGGVTLLRAISAMEKLKGANIDEQIGIDIDRKSVV